MEKFDLRKDSTLFSAKKIGAMMVKNRLVRSATYEGMADDNGLVDNRYVALYENLARGGVGMIIAGFAFVQENGIAAKNQTGIHTDECIPMLKKAVDVVHRVNENVNFVLQIAHGGRQVDSDLVEKMKNEPLAPSSIADKSIGIIPKEMTIEDIEDVTQSFVTSAERAKRAGFDGVQLHGAHGYLLSEFLSPHMNKRTDDHGGSTENRLRIVTEIFENIKETCGKDWPVLIKLQIDDFVKEEPSLKPPESTEIARRIAEAGFDAIEISGGIYESDEKLDPWNLKVKNADEEAYFLPYAKKIKKIIGETPLILVGGIRSFMVAENIVKDGYADFTSMSRPLIMEPDLPKKWFNKLSDKSTCTSCNRCETEMNKKGLSCLLLESKG
ncbi:MAG: NADH:flavin oxidoreductase [Candidatus Bathyarchaeota archaeon]|nr:MAG: NADH:flavin oxidoreductase [Candidatus Bathyarchaeota archaeon]